MNKTIIFATLALLLTACPANDDKETHVELETTHGKMVLKLYNETPGHRDNFIKLVENGFYDDIHFHRIIEEFMIQTGNPRSRAAYKKGSDISSQLYTIPEEITPSLFHRKGAVGAARTGDNINPLRNSSGTQFYIVQGKVYNEEELMQQEERINDNLRSGLYYRYMREEREKAEAEGVEADMTMVQEAAALRMHDEMESREPYIIPQNHKDVYMSEGGTPHLDMNYTVFGQLVEGFEVVDKIAAEKRDEADKPLSDNVRILSARILKRY